MTSSMSTGDRRWASSTRRSGMTVLGKVAVPKPINLPSQKLENHGLDPNVEIVPKGTHSWGSKPSSQTNAWGLSSVSPNTDGGTGSPSHLSGCPSSGGSNTRPSTAGSDGPHEPAVNAWGPNSRPSSASGALSSNHSSLSTLRPHSAETQPGSSQLSRFAEPLSVNPVARGGSTDKGISSSKNNFSLTSGDFPTLGSEKEKIENTGLEGDANVTASSNSEATNTWRRDEERFGKDVMPSEMRQEDVHSFPNASMPPNHYEAWHGPPVNNPSGGTWYRGPPYGAPLPPGSFPMEPFPYYRPHFPPNALVNSQLRGAGPRVHHPMSADMQRPLMPDPYLRPGLPIRPGFCPGPVPYESYYGPPMGYCNRSKQNKPFMGFPRGSVYNELPRQNGPDPANSHARSGGHTGKASAMGQVESDHFHDSSGPFKILTKQHNGSDRHMLEDPVTTSFEKGDLHKKSGRSGWEADNKKDEMIATQRAEQSETHLKVSDRHTESNSFAMLSSGIVGNRKQPDIRSTERMEMPASALAVSQSTAADPKDSCLIKKIYGLNSKARSSDARPEVLSDCSREEQNTKSQIYPRASFPANSGGTGLLPSKGLKPFETRKPVNSRADFTSRSYSGKQNRFETTPAAEGNVSGVYLGTDVNSQEHHADAEGRERPATYSQKKLWGGPSRQTLNANEFRGQEHVEMRMSAELHSTSLQNKGEHVTKQKANATEIPKEIDRHCYEVQDSKQKLETFSAGASMNKKEDSCTVTETNLIVGTVVCPNKPHSSAPNPNFVSPVTIGDANRSERPTSNENVLERRPKNAHKESAAVEKQPFSFQMEVNNLDAGVRSNVLPNHGNAAAKDKHSGYKHKQNVPLESSLANCTLSSGNDVGLNCHPDEANEVTTQEVTCEIAPISESSVHAGKKAISESLGHQKRRSNWTGKGKQRVYEDPALTSRKAEIRNTSVEPVESELVFSSIQAGTDSKDAIPTPAQHIHVRNEETPDGINSQWKSQHSGAMSRNPQSTRSSGKFNNADAVVWAPVCSQNKNGVINHDSSQNRSEVTDDGTDRKTVPEVAPLKKVDQYVRTNPKSKRAEMERYVPKPVAKEMAQQASNQQPTAPSHGQFAEGETVEGVESDLQSVENPQHVRTTIVKGSPSIRHNNQGKTQASWRPRSSESANTQVLQDGSSYSLKTGKYKSINAKPDSVPGKEQSDGWNIQHNPDSVPHANLVKNHDATAREKRQFYKGHRGAVNSHDRVTKNNNEGGDNTKTHSPAPDMIQADFTSAKENCNAAERVTSHWQHNPRGTSHRRGGRSTGRDDIWTNKSDYLPHTGVPLQKHREAHQVIVEPHTGHAVSEKSHEVPDQLKREKKPSSSGGRPQSTNQASADLTESASVTTDTRHEQLTFSHGNVKTNWFSRGHGSSSKWSIPEQSSRKDDQSGNWERQRSNTSYQYKPVAPYNNRPNDNKGPEDGSQETGSMYVERGQRHSRRGRGNLYGQQRRHIRVDAGRD